MVLTVIGSVLYIFLKEQGLQEFFNILFASMIVSLFAFMSPIIFKEYYFMCSVINAVLFLLMNDYVDDGDAAAHACGGGGGGL